MRTVTRSLIAVLTLVALAACTPSAPASPSAPSSASPSAATSAAPSASPSAATSVAPSADVSTAPSAEPSQAAGTITFELVEPIGLEVFADRGLTPEDACGFAQWGTNSTGTPNHTNTFFRQLDCYDAEGDFLPSLIQMVLYIEFPDEAELESYIDEAVFEGDRYLRDGTTLVTVGRNPDMIDATDEVLARIVAVCGCSEVSVKPAA